METVLPELVATDQGGNKPVACQNVVPLLVEAIKDLRQIIDTIQRQIVDLKAGRI